MNDIYQSVLTALKGTGIEFAEESWQDAPDTAYGVLSMDGTVEERYADDELIWQRQEGAVDLYTPDQGFTDSAKVEEALRSIEDVTVRPATREFLSDWRLMHYRWFITLQVVG